MAYDLSGLPDYLKGTAISQSPLFLKRIMLDGPEIAKHCQLVSDFMDLQPIIDIRVSDGVQPGAKNGVNPKGDIAYTGRHMPIKPFKIDLKFGEDYLEALYKTYLGQVSGDKINPNELPFHDYTWNLVIDMAMRGTNLASVRGNYNQAGTSHLDCMDGALTIVTDEKAAGNIPAGNIPAGGAAITPVNAIDQIHPFINKVNNNADVVSEKFKVFASPDLVKAYADCYRSTWSQQPLINKENIVLVDNDPRFELVPLTPMAGSGYVIVTPETNLFWNMYFTKPFRVTENLRDIYIFGDWRCGFQYGSMDRVFINSYAGIA